MGFFKNIFSYQKEEFRYIINFFGIKIRIMRPNAVVRSVCELTSYKADKAELENYIDEQNKMITDMYLRLNKLYTSEKFDIKSLLFKKIKPLNISYINSDNSYIEYLFPNLDGTFDIKEPIETSPNFFYTCGIRNTKENVKILSSAINAGEKAYIIEDCFLRSVFPQSYMNVKSEYRKSIGFTIDDITAYYDSTLSSRLEQMLNDKSLVITDEQICRARNCINKIVETHISKYNNQPILIPKYGQNGIKKVLVVDQSYGDYSVIKGGATDETFRKMLKDAIEENPDADILIKTHPDTFSGQCSCYYADEKSHDNIYKITEPINPISLINYVDKVYVCSSQFGFEALMCGKEVHVYGIPFYQGWGLTYDKQHCERRTNCRTIEELFYISYIMYSHYVNPKTKKQCEIEDAIEYLTEIRNEVI